MDVEFSVEVVKKKTFTWPRLENNDYFMVLGSARPLLEALQHATSGLQGWLMTEYGYSERSAASLMGQAMEYEVSNIVDPNYTFTKPPLNAIDYARRKVILLTSHRRENFGAPMAEVFSACRELVEKNPDVELIYPVHPNPNVQQTAKEILAGVDRVHLIEPLEYRTFVQLMSKCYLILTDSGGVQEEAPTLGKPVLVLRSTTERPEAIEAGTGKLVGTSRIEILHEAQKLLSDRKAYEEMSTKANPYGDGKSAGRIVDIIVRQDSILSHKGGA
jgi:UDP-N-acetylglucosamine 2-epimerase